MADESQRRRARRSVGARAGIDLRAIVHAARSLPSDGITMQAVADILGVDRSAVNYHVRSRDQLRQLVAEASFAESFSSAEFPVDAGWRVATRVYVRTYAEAMEAAGSLAEHLQHTFGEDRFLRTTEALLQLLVDAGFSDEFAVRYLVTLGYLARGFARDRIALEQGTAQRRSTHTQQAIRERDPRDFPNLDRVSARAYDTYGDEQLTAAVDAVIAGAAAALARRPGGPAPGE